MLIGERLARSGVNIVPETFNGQNIARLPVIRRRVARASMVDGVSRHVGGLNDLRHLLERRRELVDYTLTLKNCDALESLNGQNEL